MLTVYMKIRGEEIEKQGFEGIEEAVKLLRKLPPKEKVGILVIYNPPIRFANLKILLDHVSCDQKNWITAGKAVKELIKIKEDF